MVKKSFCHCVKMCKVQMLRALVKQRLTAAAEEIFVLFERAIAEYEQELSRSKEKNERQQKLLDAVFNPQLRLHRTAGQPDRPVRVCRAGRPHQKHVGRCFCHSHNCQADVRQLLAVKEEVPPEQQKQIPSLDQEDPEPPHIKEEQDDPWTSQKGEQLKGLEEADINFPFSPVSVKSEDEEEEPQSSHLHQRQTEQMETEADGEDIEGPEPSWNSDPDTYLQPGTGDSSEPETDDSYDWKETTEPQSDLNYLMENYEVPVSDSRCSAGEKTFSCSECGKTFSRNGHLKRHMRTHTGEKPFSCSVCEKSFTQSGALQNHMRIYTGLKHFSCSACGKCFIESRDLERHMSTHIGEESFSCSLCMKSFTQHKRLQRHMISHTGVKPFSCLVCGNGFIDRGGLKRHMIIHTGEKPFSCFVCAKRFVRKDHLKSHIRIHLGDNPI